jgi:AmiR/NasT family two-component response regulator
MDVATGVAATARRCDEQRRTIDQLQGALDSRVVIEQAKGVISAERSVSVDEAFAVLRRHANDHNAKLHDVADAVVRLGLRPD